MITAESITDEQIRELRSDLRTEQERLIAEVDECNWALSRGQGFIPDSSIDDVHARRGRARARCAEILNARAAKEAK